MATYDSVITGSRTDIDNSTILYLVKAGLNRNRKRLFSLKAAESSSFSLLRADPTTRAINYWAVDTTLFLHEQLGNNVLFNENEELQNTSLTSEQVQAFFHFSPNVTPSIPFRPVVNNSQTENFLHVFAITSLSVFVILFFIMTFLAAAGLVAPAVLSILSGFFAIVVIPFLVGIGTGLLSALIDFGYNAYVTRRNRAIPNVMQDQLDPVLPPVDLPEVELDNLGLLAENRRLVSHSPITDSAFDSADKSPLYATNSINAPRAHGIFGGSNEQSMSLNDVGNPLDLEFEPKIR